MRHEAGVLAGHQARLMKDKMPAQKYPFLYEGEVTRRDDPDGLGRIKVRIPGVVEPETPSWAFPIGSQGGGWAQHGSWEPPPIGANVNVVLSSEI